MDNYIIAILIILFITIVTLYVIYTNELIYQNEMIRINKLEKQYEEENKKIEELSKKTKKCPIDGLTNPRSCYFKSNYNCKWNELLRRCDSL